VSADANSCSPGAGAASVSDVVMNTRARLRSVASRLNAPASAISSVNRYQSRHKAASRASVDEASAAPIS
jgi:hypothetical protein